MNPHSLYWLCAAIALAYLPHAVYLPPWVSAVLALTLVLRPALGRPLPGWFLAPLAVVGLAAVLYEFHSINGYEPGTSLLAVMIGLKVLETRSLRDGGLLACLAYFQAAAILLVSQEIHTTIHVLFVVLLTTVALVSLASEQGPPLRAQIRTAGIITAQALPVMLVLFLLFPRLPGPLWGFGERGGGEETARTGLSDGMEPGNVAELAVSREVAFRVQFDGDPPAAGDLYWRGLVLSDFDGRRWSRGDASVDGSVQAEFIGEPIDYNVTLQPHGERWVFALDLPAASPSGTRSTRAFELRSRERIDSATRFELRSVLDYRMEFRLAEERRQRTLSLPDTGAPRARALADEWRAASETPAETVERALAWFRDRDFTYTLSPQILADDPVDEFLFDTREGFCESYASTFAVLMRAAGIPARVVLGYQGAEGGLGDYLIVRQAHAHAWTEVWLPERGWTRIDPTAAAAPARIQDGPATATAAGGTGSGLFGGGLGIGFYLELAWDSMHFSWDQFVLGYGPELQDRLLAQIGLDGLRRYTLGALAVIAVGVVMVAIWLPWQRPRRARDPVVRAWQRVERRLATIGLRRDRGEGVRDFARRVARSRPELADKVNAIAGRYLRLRYHPEPSAQDRARLEREAAAFRPLRPRRRQWKRRT